MAMKQNKWRLYEQEKGRLRSLKLSPAEYERRVRELAKRLGV